MFNIKYTILLALLLLTNFNFSQSQMNVQNTIEKNAALNKIKMGGEEFSLELFKRISVIVEPSNYNYMISPFSIWSLLVLIAEGAGGNTFDEIRKTTRLDSDIKLVREGYMQIQKALNVNTSTVEVSTLRAIFCDNNQPINPSYIDTVKTYIGEIVPLNFRRISETVKKINGIVNTGTKGLIDSIVKDEDIVDSKMVLVSAIFFKGQWKFPFNRTFTRSEPFYNEKSTIVGNVDMMFNRGPFLYAALAALDCHILELPYGVENRLAMLIFLPRQGANLTSVVEKIAEFGVVNIYNELKKASEGFEDDEVEVFLPRFSTTSDFILNVVLEEMGILDLFDSVKSNLTKISSSPMFLSRVLHKTKIEVNEEGTTASAVTGGIFMNKATPPRFKVNRPFAYIITEKTTNSILFCGEVRNPFTG